MDSTPRFSDQMTNVETHKMAIRNIFIFMHSREFEACQVSVAVRIAAGIACLFGCVEGMVYFVQQTLDVLVMAVESSCPNGNCYIRFGSVGIGEVMAADALVELGEAGNDILFIHGIQKENELIASPADNTVLLADIGLDDLDGFLQHKISVFMTVVIVDPLEIVDIKHGNDILCAAVQVRLKAVFQQGNTVKAAVSACEDVIRYLLLQDVHFIQVTGAFLFIYQVYIEEQGHNASQGKKIA